MKILYLSCHSILEYDEVKLFTEMGHDVFSHGVYANPAKPGDPKRPAIEAKYHDDLYNMHITHSKDDLHQDMIDWADIVICMHITTWLSKNWEKFGDTPVVWRSIGQSTLEVEKKVRPLRKKGLKIIRYSPREKTIPGFAGEDAMIRFYKDPKEFGPYTGEIKQVLTVGQSMKQRHEFCNFGIFEKATHDLPRLLVGPGNDDVTEMDHKLVDYEELIDLYRKSRVYFYTGTYPASYTLNFIEAYMSGAPVVALGHRYGSSPFERGQDTYEVPDIITTGKNGFYADTVNELREYMERCLDDVEYAKKIGAEGRKTAVEYFGKEKAKKDWGEFFSNFS